MKNIVFTNSEGQHITFVARGNLPERLAEAKKQLKAPDRSKLLNSLLDAALTEVEKGYK